MAYVNTVALAYSVTIIGFNDILAAFPFRRSIAMRIRCHTFNITKLVQRNNILSPSKHVASILLKLNSFLKF